MEYRLRRHDGEYRWLLDSGVPLYNASGELLGYIGSAVDITDRKHVEDALSEADRRKDQFLAVLSHELRNPLAPIRNAVEIMKITGLSKDKLDWCRDLIDQQVSHMARLLEDLLDLSRITRNSLDLRKEPADLAEIIRDAIQVSSPVISEARHSLITVIPPQKIPLFVDRVRLTQVFVNLLNNAARYTEPNGTIRLSVQVKKQSGELSATISISDNGIGLDADVLPRIFDMFVQGKPRTGQVPAGLGIGLTLSREIVHLHGGTISAMSEGLGKGSEFVVKLPLADE
jgi:signal transduction histidine kinase